MSGTGALPPPGRSGGEWGTTTYVGALTWAAAICAIPSIVGWAIILLFLPLDSMDVYKVEGKLYAADGKYYKGVTEHNFEVVKYEHTDGGVPAGKTGGGTWGTTQYVGSLTWAMAFCAALTIIGPFVILLFLPLDNRDIYKDGTSLYKANGEWFKTASDHNFDVRRSAHVTDGTPEGWGVLGKDGEWGTMTYIGPLTWAVSIASIFTVIGPIIILLFLPLDKEEVYRLDGKLYLPNGQYYKAATVHNFDIKKSEHTDGTPPRKSGGEWGTTTYIGPYTWSMTIASFITIIGFIPILLFCPLDQKEVYKVDGKLYTPSGDYFKAATEHNFMKRNSKHVQSTDPETPPEAAAGEGVAKVEEDDVMHA